MSQLQRRSDGACETKEGLFAVKLRVVSGVKDGMNWFEFKPSIMSQVIRIEWPKDALFALLPQDEARTLVRSGYAIGITDQEMELYNKAVAAGEQQPAPAIQPAVQQPPAPPSPEPSWAKAATAEPAPTSALPQATPTVQVAAPVASPPLKPIEPVVQSPLKPIEPST